jgi:hypothetical protein
MDSISGRIITAPVGEFCALSGLGRTKVYEMLGEGLLDSITIGKRRLIVLDSYRRLIERQCATKTHARTAEAARSPMPDEERRAVDTGRHRFASVRGI